MADLKKKIASIEGKIDPNDLSYDQTIELDDKNGEINDNISKPRVKKVVDIAKLKERGLSDIFNFYSK